MSVFLGIDPDMRGGLAVIDQPSREVYLVRRMPVREKSKVLNQPARIDARGLWNDLVEARRVGATYVILEQPGFFAGNEKGVDRKHQNFGCIRGLCELAFTPSRVILAPPSVWKKAVGVSSDKVECRAKACELFPSHVSLLKMTKNTGIAEAALMTEWGPSRI